jgi:hypothetical protein
VSHADTTGRNSIAPWERKAHEVIAKYCRESWLHTNTPNAATRKLLRDDPSVRLYKKHRPYSVPAIAAALVNALAIHDSRAREHEIKRLFEIERSSAWSLI